MAGERVRAWTDQVRADARGLVAAVRHRVQFGDPPLLVPAEDAGVSTLALLDAKRQRIRRRRALLGLDYEEYSGPGARR
ncbi:MAG: hypothetical protein ACRECT_00270 [Thermoplasmata archaeon]